MRVKPMWWFVLPLCLALAGCGGGGEDEDDDDVDPPVDPADAAGLWRGTGSVAGSTIPYEFEALVTSDGRLRLLIFSTDSPTTLALTLIQGDLRGPTGTLVLNSGRHYSFSLPNIGEVRAEFDGEPRSKMTGSVTFGGKTYHLDGTYDAQFERTSSLATIAGVYTRTAGTFTITLVIDANGSLTGSDTRNCTYTGTVSADLPTINAYSFGWTASGCTGFGFNGFFSGRMALIDSRITQGAQALSVFAHSDTFPAVPYFPAKP